jgi:hypothetical protein
MRDNVEWKGAEVDPAQMQSALEVVVGGGGGDGGGDGPSTTLS